MSSIVTSYDEPVASEIADHESIVVSAQRSHRRAYPIVADPVQEPRPDVSVCMSTAAPETVGSAVFAGAMS